MTRIILVGTTEIKVAIGRHKMEMVQNISGNNVIWRSDESRGTGFILYPGDFIKVNYDIYLWTESEGASEVVVGEIDE